MNKKYYSEITKNNYILQETITKMQYLESQEMNKENDNFILCLWHWWFLGLVCIYSYDNALLKNM